MKELQQAFETGKLKFTILEECAPEVLNEREQVWMNRYTKRINRSKTVTNKGIGPETREKLRQAMLGKKLSAETRKKDESKSIRQNSNNGIT